jgi:hypothetical protein
MGRRVSVASPTGIAFENGKREEGVGAHLPPYPLMARHVRARVEKRDKGDAGGRKREGAVRRGP